MIHESPLPDGLKSGHLRVYSVPLKCVLAIAESLSVVSEILLDCYPGAVRPIGISRPILAAVKISLS